MPRFVFFGSPNRMKEVCKSELFDSASTFWYTAHR